MSQKTVLSHRKRLHCYYSAMRIAKHLYVHRFISFKAYEKIEKELAEKYGIDEKSLFRIKPEKIYDED